MFYTVRIATFPTFHFSDVKFPLLRDCAHFHYSSVLLLEIVLSVDDVQCCSSGLIVILRVRSNDTEWTIRRTWSQLVNQLDRRLHRCVVRREVSGVPDLSAVHTTDIEVSTCEA